MVKYRNLYRKKSPIKNIFSDKNELVFKNIIDFSSNLLGQRG